jgi:hypothetical protein
LQHTAGELLIRRTKVAVSKKIVFFADGLISKSFTLLIKIQMKAYVFPGQGAHLQEWVKIYESLQH